MANPFDQFDEQTQEKVSQPAAIAPGQSPTEAAVAAAPQTENVSPDNPFNQLEAPGPLTDDQFASQFYDKLNAGESPEAIMQWAEQNGRKIITEGAGGEAWITNLAERDRALAEGRKGVYGRIANNDTGVVPGDTLSGAGAFVRKAANVPLFYFGDEAVAAGLALAQDDDYWTNYEENWRRLNAQDQMDEAANPTASTLGEVAGMGASMFMPGAIYDKGVRMLAPKMATRVPNIAVRAGVGAGTGAAAGATGATGEGSVDDRFEDTSGGALIGGLIGAGFPLVAEGVGRLARPIRERLFANSGRSMGDRMNLTNEELAAAEAELQRQKDLGLSPTLLDVLPERARKVVGSAGVHDTAQEALQDVARTRRVQLPERVQTQADEVLQPSDAPRSAEQTKTALDTFRREDLDARLEPIRRNPLTMTPGVQQVLATREGQRAIQDAIATELEPELRDQMARLASVAKQLESLDPRLPEAARNQIAAQLMQDAPFTINAAEKISRALSRRAGSEGADAGVLNAFSRTIRDAARTDPAFAAAMEAGRAQHQAREAVELGEQFLSSGNADEFVESAEGFADTSMARLPGEEITAPSNRDLARVGAANATRTRAGQGPSEAASTAERFFDSPEQRRRTEALVGTAKADELAARMKGEVERVYRATAQASREGPGRESGVQAVENIANALYQPGSPIPWTREVARFLHRIGMTERDAKWIVDNATNESKAGEMLELLQKHGMSRDRAIVYQQELRDSLIKYLVAQEGGS